MMECCWRVSRCYSWDIWRVKYKHKRHIFGLWNDFCFRIQVNSCNNIQDPALTTLCPQFFNYMNMNNGIPVLCPYNDIKRLKTCSFAIKSQDQLWLVLKAQKVSTLKVDVHRMFCFIKGIKEKRKDISLRRWCIV